MLLLCIAVGVAIRGRRIFTTINSFHPSYYCEWWRGAQLDTPSCSFCCRGCCRSSLAPITFSRGSGMRTEDEDEVPHHWSTTSRNNFLSEESSITAAWQVQWKGKVCCQMPSLLPLSLPLFPTLLLYLKEVHRYWQMIWKNYLEYKYRRIHTWWTLVVARIIHLSTLPFKRPLQSPSQSPFLGSFEWSCSLWN